MKLGDLKKKVDELYDKFGYDMNVEYHVIRDKEGNIIDPDMNIGDMSDADITIFDNFKVSATQFYKNLKTMEKAELVISISNDLTETNDIEETDKGDE